MYLIAFPLLLVPFALYNMIAFLLDLPFDTALYSFSLLSGQSMAVSAGDALVILGVLLLYVEILKVTRLAGRTVMDHLLSVMLFAAMVFEFVSVPRGACTPKWPVRVASACRAQRPRPSLSSSCSVSST